MQEGLFIQIQCSDPGVMVISLLMILKRFFKNASSRARSVSLGTGLAGTASIVSFDPSVVSADEIMKGPHPAPVHDHLSACAVRFFSQAIFIKGPDGIFHRIAELIGSEFVFNGHGP